MKHKFSKQPEARLRALIVDDEPPAREIIKEYLHDFPAIEVTGECKNGRLAVQHINDKRPDLIFLDIQMPGMNGFEVLERLQHLPLIIFCTAYDRFALQAFEVNAVDYLLKPFSRERFRKAVRRALQQRENREPEIERIARLLAHAAPPHFAERLFVRSGQKLLPVETSAIMWIEAEGDYARLHLQQGKSVLCSMGVGLLQERLDPAAFTRVHRSYIVHLAAVRHLESDGEGGYFAVLKDGARIRVSRSYAPKIKDLIL